MRSAAQGGGKVLEAFVEVVQKERLEGFCEGSSHCCAGSSMSR